jgi:hypothetical protein
MQQTNEHEPNQKGLADTWSRLLSFAREIKLKRAERNQETFRGPTLLKILKWSQQTTEEISTEQYVYTYLADASSGVGLLEMMNDNQDATVRCLAKVITRLVEVGIISVDELAEMISDYRHDITLKPSDSDDILS